MIRGTNDLNNLNIFANAVKVEICEYLSESRPLPLRLQQAISCCKVLGVNKSIELCHELRQEVGSYALMSTSGFGQTDFLQGCKFAEGDNRILQLKMARDAMRSIATLTGEERQAAETLKLRMIILMKRNGGDKVAAWNESWKNVYELARAHCEQRMRGFVESKL